jgi:transposase InsO family protein
MQDHRKADQIATERAEMLGPLLTPGLDPAKRSQIIREISNRYQISERSIRRYLKTYAEDGFVGLRPKGRDYHGKASSVDDFLVDQAIALRREVPTRSIRQIIRILEMEGLVAEGQIRRSTLQDRLEDRGFSSRQLRMYHSSGGAAARRFAHRHRNDLWQADLKYLLVLPATATEKSRQLYASVFIDDATRSIVHAQVYEKQDWFSVLDCFRKAIDKNGLPDAVFVDNGSQYIGKSFSRTCAKLGIKKLHARPRAASAKGKVEKFNRFLDSFVAEVKLKNPKSVAEVDHHLQIWIQELYQKKPHAALDGKTPEQAFLSDSRVLRFATGEQLLEAFQMAETRLVNKAGCLSFRGREFEAGQDFIGFKVEVLSDPACPDEIEIRHPGFEPRRIGPLIISPRSAPRKRDFEPFHANPPVTSRELDAAARLYEQKTTVKRPAVSYKNHIIVEDRTENSHV